MRFIDITFAATLVAFGLGAVAGAFVTAVSLSFRLFMLLLINFRVFAPVKAVSESGKIAIMLLIFLNNCVPIILSFAYALILCKVQWEPPMRPVVRKWLLTAFSLLTGGLLGFFNLGATLMLVAKMWSPTVVNALLQSSWAHAPLEFLLILACVAEPMRLSRRTESLDELLKYLHSDANVIPLFLFGLLVSAAIEVFVGL